MVTNDVTEVLNDNTGGPGVTEYEGFADLDGETYLHYTVGGYDLYIEFDAGTTIGYV